MTDLTVAHVQAPVTLIDQIVAPMPTSSSGPIVVFEPVREPMTHLVIPPVHVSAVELIVAAGHVPDPFKNRIVAAASVSNLTGALAQPPASRTDPIIKAMTTAALHIIVALAPGPCLSRISPSQPHTSLLLSTSSGRRARLSRIAS